MSLPPSYPDLAFPDERAAFHGGLRYAFGAPAIAIGASFLGFGALVRESGLSLWHGLISTATTWALPGQVAMVELYAVGAGLVAIALAVGASATRLLPMVLTLLPLMRQPGRPRWHYYAASHLIALTGWAVTMRLGPGLPPPQRLPFFLGFTLILWLTTLAGTAIGYLLPDVLPTAVTLALVFLTPLYFTLLFMEDLRGKRKPVALACGALLGPPLFLLSPDWSLILTGLLGGSLAYVLTRKVPS
ncbi:MAG: AzlC family ABC transporter permease [Pseudomonadota bacterium]